MRTRSLDAAVCALVAACALASCQCQNPRLVSSPDGGTLSGDSGAPDAGADSTDAGGDAGASDGGGDLDAGPCVVPDAGVPALLSDAGASTRGTEFWLAYMEGLALGENEAPRFSLFVEAFQDTHGTVELFETGGTLPFFAGAAQVTEVLLPSGEPLYAQGSEVVSSFVLRVRTDQPVGLRAMHWRINFSDASLVLPTPELGTAYSVIAADGDTGPSEFVVVGTQDNTQVTLTPSVTTAGFHGAGTPFTVVLDAGESYQVQSAEMDPVQTANPVGDLSGTFVSATARVAVFAGARTTQVWCTDADNHVWDEDLPDTRLGRSYTVVPFAGQGGDPIKVVATQDNTSVRFGCGSTPVVLNAGQAFTQLVTTPTRLTASAPIAVAQYAKSSMCEGLHWGDPGMVVLTPDALTQTVSLVRPIFGSVQPDNPSLVANDHFVNLTTYQAADAGSLIVATQCGPVVQAVPGTDPSWATAQILLQYTPQWSSSFPESDATFVGQRAPTDAGVTFLISYPGGFTGVAYGFGSVDGYNYPLGYHCDGCLAALTADAGCP
jgi:hypothetical protein